MLGSNSTNGVTINGGQLSGTGAISQPVTLNGGNLAPGSSSAIGTLSLSSSLIINGGSLTFKLQNGGVSDAIDSSLGNKDIYFPNGSTPATVNLAGVPLPATGVPYYLFTGVYLEAPITIPTYRRRTCP